MSRLSVTLTTRECEVISLLARGWSMDDVGAELGLNHHAMAAYKCRIMRKTGTQDLTGIRIWAGAFTDAEFRRLTGQVPRVAEMAEVA